MGQIEWRYEDGFFYTRIVDGETKSYWGISFPTKEILTEYLNKGIISVEELISIMADRVEYYAPKKINNESNTEI